MKKQREVLSNSEPKFKQLPVTKMGWWAMGLGLGHMVLYTIEMSLIGTKYSFEQPWLTIMVVVEVVLMLVGLAGAILALITLIKKTERSWVVWAALLPGLTALLVLFFFLTSI